MTSFIPRQPGQGLLRVSLLGPMGIGKTTALRSLCGQLMAGSDVPNLDKAAHAKEFTTVGAEFGEIDLGSGERLQLVGSPGQDRFDFVRRWVLSASVGALLMIDANDSDALDYASEMLAGVAELETAPLLIILSCRPVSEAQLEAFSSALMSRGHAIVPIVQADPRDRQQMLDALGVLASLLSLQSQTL
ncbi:MAG: 50S ribosome-binding GTPase [Comamonas sp.]|jgi:signal recognition particle receptor subunit beta|uniref:GTP-binding protein n=1 Tax=Comamonas sp. TaxID=34028 RepID=UPI0028240FBC|nr:GTPase [Comamonas sp.]MDR0213343.1 50S ribosome-binding GTPase [Comamonas sp.]MDR2296983.1 50S ribosome-binding GTPase [Comamonas sp.]